MALPKGPEKLLRMIDFVKKTYSNYDLPDVAIEWFARDRCDMRLSQEEIDERKHKYNLLSNYSEDELPNDESTADPSTGEADGPGELSEAAR